LSTTEAAIEINSPYSGGNQNSLAMFFSGQMDNKLNTTIGWGYNAVDNWNGAIAFQSISGWTSNIDFYVNKIYAQEDGIGILSQTPALRIQNTTGNVGIGTTDPGAKLEVAGNIKIADGTQGAGKPLISDANGVATWGNANMNMGWYEIDNVSTLRASVVNASSVNANNAMTADYNITSNYGYVSAPYQPSARGYLKSSAAAGAGSWQAMTSNAMDFSTSPRGWSRNCTPWYGFRIEILVSGYYQVNCLMNFLAGTAGKMYGCAIYYGPTSGPSMMVESWAQSSSASRSVSPHLSDIIYFAAGNSVYPYYYTDDSSALLLGGSSGYDTYISIYKLP
jgi:hypothetical protein